MIETTLVLLKPDAVERGLVGRIIGRFEDRGLRLVGMKLLKVDKSLVSKHYGDFVERMSDKLGRDKAQAVFDEMTNFLTSGPIIAMAVEGVSAVTLVRKIVGSTYPHEALPGTIRGDFAHMSSDYANANQLTVKNLIHASGNEQEAKAELEIWFNHDDLHDYEPTHFKHTRR